MHARSSHDYQIRRTRRSYDSTRRSVRGNFIMTDYDGARKHITAHHKQTEKYTSKHERDTGDSPPSPYLFDHFYSLALVCGFITPVPRPYSQLLSRITIHSNPNPNPNLGAIAPSVGFYHRKSIREEGQCGVDLAVDNGRGLLNFCRGDRKK